ncbi:MAG: lipopolysaccharide kinase InaA family protein [Methylophaga sp.]|nr:lipopolysaccharide kinase InaA family protein [Methylophaga sp.]
MAESFKLAKLPALPLTFASPQGPVELQSVLRFLPGKRLVGKAQFQTRPVLLKLMTDNRQGRRILAKEQVGHQLMLSANLRLPAIELLSENTQGLLAIAYHWLPDARAFNEADLQQPEYCQQLLELMADLHQAGLTHEDLHVDNLLISAEKLYLVDYAAVKQLAEKPLGETASLNNLALLIVQFTDAGQQHLKDKFADYCALRNWPLTEKLSMQLEKAVKKAWRKRQRAYLKKCFRDCTMTAYHHSFRMEYAFRREFLNAVGTDFIDQLDRLIADGELLKDGNSATVAKVILDGQMLVIKRYNLKSFWHFLKRCGRPSRAANAWRFGRLLELIGLPTPKVLGFVEKRSGYFRKEAYLITEWSAAEELSKRFPDLSPTGDVATQIESIFSLLAKYQLQHGDLKASNLLIDKNDCVQLIDLDAMRQIGSANKFAEMHKFDKHRFKINWHLEV